MNFSTRKNAARYAAAVVSMSLVVVLTSCASSDDPGSDPSSGGSTGAGKTAAEQAAFMAADCGGPEADWQTVIEGAQKEGGVVTTGPAEPAMQEAITGEFEKTFGIPVTYNGGASSTVAQKLKAERAAGISSVDTFLGGANTMYTVVYAEGWLDDMKAQVISPDVLDPKNWLEGKLPFKDPEGNKIWTISKYGEPAFVVNTDTADDVKGWQDMLDPKYKGRIAILDPSSGAGLGFNVMLELYSVLGEDYMRQLLVDQKPVFISDSGQAADDLARGKYDIGIGIARSTGDLEGLKADGLPISPRNADDAPAMVNSGFGLLGIMTEPPHPNAAKLFANWLLCPAGNTVWNVAGSYGSARVDVKTDIPEYSKFDPKSTEHWDTYGWELVTGDESKAVEALLKTLMNT